MTAIDTQVFSSPRKRFWMTCLLVPVVALLIAFGAPYFDPPRLVIWTLAFVAWASGVYWVLSGYARGVGGFSRLPVGRIVLVVLGLTIGIALVTMLLAGIIAVTLVRGRY